MYVLKQSVDATRDQDLQLLLPVEAGPMEREVLYRKDRAQREWELLVLEVRPQSNRRRRLQQPGLHKDKARSCFERGKLPYDTAHPRENSTLYRMLSSHWTASDAPEANTCHLKVHLCRRLFSSRPDVN